jgi:chromosome segregation ATPase
MESKRALRESSLATLRSLHGIDDICSPSDEELEEIKDARRKVREAQELQSQYQKAKKLVARYEGLVTDITPIIEAEGEARKAGKSVSRFLEIARKRKTLRSTLQSLDDEIKKKEREVSDLADDILTLEKEAGTCPTCGKPLEDCDA